MDFNRFQWILMDFNVFLIFEKFTGSSREDQGKLKGSSREVRGKFEGSSREVQGKFKGSSREVQGISQEPKSTEIH